MSAPPSFTAQQGRDYVQRTKLSSLIETALNEVMETKPDDFAGVLARLIRRHALPPTVDRLVGREVLDSRGNPTVEVDVFAQHLGEVVFAGRSSAPSGASTGSNEARELRDTESPRYGGKGTLGAVGNVSAILSPAVKGLGFGSLSALDAAVTGADGTELKEKVGGNATTATSFALATAAARLGQEELFLYLARQFHGDATPAKFKLPTPCFNILNGGKHAGGDLKLQEFMIAPSDRLAFPDQLRVAAEVYQKLGAILAAEKGASARNLGDEGGYAPPLGSPEEALSYIERAIREAGYTPGEDVRIALDPAASEFYDAETRLYEVELGVKKTGDEMVAYWKDLVERHPAIFSIEDGLHETDYEHWQKLTVEIGARVQLVGDDLYTTNPGTIRRGLEGKWCNALLLKVNQIGTISEAMDAARLVLAAGQSVMVSHRSGETGNSLIANLAVATGARYIKTGSTARGERIEKYTRLLQIYDFLKERDMLAE